MIRQYVLVVMFLNTRITCESELRRLTEPYASGREFFGLCYELCGQKYMSWILDITVRILELTTKAGITHAISIVLVNIVIWSLGTLSNCEINLLLFALSDPRTVHFHFCGVTCFKLRLSFIRPKSNFGATTVIWRTRL